MTHKVSLNSLVLDFKRTNEGKGVQAQRALTGLVAFALAYNTDMPDNGPFGSNEVSQLKLRPLMKNVVSDVNELYCVDLGSIAREVFWKEGLNFNHGTGHGVGYLLNIHEGPINFRWKEGERPAPALEENMVITDEPGIYIEGSHGIRLENELLVRKTVKNEYGQFMNFEILTYVPIDLDAILPEKMSTEEKEMLNHYHKQVYEKVSPYLSEEERIWLKEYTRAVK